MATLMAATWSWEVPLRTRAWKSSVVDVCVTGASRVSRRALCSAGVEVEWCGLDEQPSRWIPLVDGMLKGKTVRGLVE